VELELFGGVGLGAVPLVHDPRVDPAGGAELRHLLEDGVVRVEEEGELRGELVDVEPAIEAVLDVREPVGEGEGEFLNRRRPASRM